MLNSGFDAIIVRDSHDRIISWNRAAEKLYGWTAEEALGQVTHVLFNTRFSKPLDEITQDLHRDNRWKGELVHTRKDGRSVTVLSHWVLDHHAQSQTSSVLEINIDISARKHAEERFRLAVEAAPAAMIMVDSRGTIGLANALAEKLLRYGTNELVGLPVERLVPERLRNRHVEYRTHYALSAETASNGSRPGPFAVRKDGSEVPVEIGLSPIRTTDGTFVVSAITDITQRRRATEAESQARRAAEDANRAKDEFLAMLSHELRNPLSSILGWAPILRTGQMPIERAGHALEVIERNARVEAEALSSYWPPPRRRQSILSNTTSLIS